jgi:alkylation response protein AidB-like acyl-CoA dehydrogenase
MDFELTPEQKQLVLRVDRLVKERIFSRAARYDRSSEFPVEDIQDLHGEGWLLVNLERRYGGLGYGLDGDDPLAFFLLIEHLAHGNPSTAHCFQVHNNTLMMINAMATEKQRNDGLSPPSSVERYWWAPVPNPRVHRPPLLDGWTAVL